MRLSLVETDTPNPKPKGATPAVVTKFTALGEVRWPTSVQPVAGGAWVGVVAGQGGERPAFLGSKDPVARPIEGCPTARYRLPDVRPDGKVVHFTEYFGEGNASCRLHRFDVGDGSVRVIYDGPNWSFDFALHDHLVSVSPDQVQLLKPNGAGGNVLGTRPLRVPDGGAAPSVVHDGRVVLVRSKDPAELIAYGIYPGEPEPLRRIGSVPYGHSYLTLGGRVTIEYGKKLYEMQGLAAAYVAARTGEVVVEDPRPGELGLRFVTWASLQPPARVTGIPALNVVHDDVIRCAGDQWVTRVEQSRKQSTILLVDDATLAIRKVDLPPGEVQAIQVDESGRRALLVGDGPAATLEVSLPDLTIRKLGPGDLAKDFGPDGRLVTTGPQGLHLLAPAGAEWRTVATAEVQRVSSVATALDGRVVLAHFWGVEPGIAVFGIYDDELRLIGALDSPPAAFPSSVFWKRRGARVFAWRGDVWEVMGLAEAYERGAGVPGRPLGVFAANSRGQRPRTARPGQAMAWHGVKVAGPAKPVAPRQTPRLDALIAEIQKRPKRAVPEAAHTRAFARKLPNDVRRLVDALSTHQHGYVSVRHFGIDEKTLATRAPGPDGERDDLLVIGGDGGGNLYAIDEDDSGAECTVLFLDHEEGFADRTTGHSLESLLEEQAEAEEEEEDGGGRDEEDDAAPVKNTAAPSNARRLTCTEGGSSKFWEGKVEGNDLTTRWGKIGTEGQTKTKSFASAEAARQELEKAIKEKLGKGYV